MMASTSLREASNYGDRPNVDRYQDGGEERFGCVGVGLASPVLRDQRPAIVLITGSTRPPGRSAADSRACERRCEPAWLGSGRDALRQMGERGEGQHERRDGDSRRRDRGQLRIPRMVACNTIRPANADRPARQPRQLRSLDPRSSRSVKCTVDRAAALCVGRSSGAARQLTMGRAGQVFIDGPVDHLSRDPEGSRPVGSDVIRTR